MSAAVDSATRVTHPNLILAICFIRLLIVCMDVTIVNVALPAIQKDLHARMAGLQWILDAYTLVVASFLILAGSMSDRFGRRKVFQVGLGVFTLGSLLCSRAGTIEQLIGFRAVQGLGASMLNPVALSIIANAFPEPKSRARAVGIWGAVVGLSLGIGPVIGGALTETIGWRSIFWINVPIGIAAGLLAARFVPESKAERARAYDPVGQALVLTGLATLTWGVIEGPHAGWASPLILGLFLTAALACLAFVLYEPRRRDPLLELRFFRSMPFSSATVLALSAYSCFVVSVVAASHARGIDFRRATHAIWWAMTACGAAVLLLGFASSTARARSSMERIAHLFEEQH
jgi:EmrB/QacA subfamily drug resistance transporter